MTPLFRPKSRSKEDVRIAVGKNLHAELKAGIPFKQALDISLRASGVKPKKKGFRVG